MSTWHEVAPVAQQFGVSPHKVLRWIEIGELTAVNVAATTSSRPRWRISQEALDAFIAARQSRPAAPAPIRTRKRAGGKEYV
jgi:excisionase family DNA binding protein